MPARLARLLSCIAACCLAVGARAQLTSAQAGFLDAVADFGADNTGATVTTAALQAALNASTAQHKPLYIPAGTYLVDATLVVADEPSDREDQNTFITGAGGGGPRTVIVLKAGTFPNAAAPGHVLLHEGWGDEDYPNTFNRILHNLDIRIEGSNAGAIGLRWRGAEGCALFDVRIDVTGGLAGIDGMAGSGGSTAVFEVVGGQYAIDIRDTTQPTPVVTAFTARGQTAAVIRSRSTRGPIVLAGARIDVADGVPVFDIERHNTSQYSPGGDIVLVDSVIAYASAAGANTVFAMANGRDVNVYLENVHVLYADTLLNEDAVVAGNPSGWRLFRRLSYDCGWDRLAPSGFGHGNYLDGVRQPGSVVQTFEDGVAPPPGLTERHGWRRTFPTFEMPGAVNVRDHQAAVVNGDWAPAFAAAIAAAEANGSNIVFVPPGDYTFYDTVDLRPHTALVGAGHKNSRLLGCDAAGRRFGGSTSGWEDPRPMIRTPDSPSATCVLADIGVHVRGPYNNAQHSPEALACYAILWRAGASSIIRNIDYTRELTTNYRASLVLRNNLGDSDWLNLRTLASPSTIDGLVFSSASATRFHEGGGTDPVPDRLNLETLSGNQRLMTRALPPPRFNNIANPAAQSNLRIARPGGAAFSLASLRLANASWLAREGPVVTLRATGGNGGTVVVDLAQRARTSPQIVTLDWTGVTQVDITATGPFSVDDLVTDTGTVTFASVVGSAVAEDVDYNEQQSGWSHSHLPMFLLAHPYVLVTGSVRYFNHWKHGSTWMRVTEPYLRVDNDPEDTVLFYHLHAQHSQNECKVELRDAHNVTVFGVKTENVLEFLRAVRSTNVTVLGHGGLTNPGLGSAHYRFEECTDYAVFGVADEITFTSSIINPGNSDALLIRTALGAYDDIQDVVGGVLHTPLRTDSPALWMRGNPRIVSQPEPTPLERIEVAPAAVTLATGQTITFTARGFGANGVEVLPLPPVTWSAGGVGSITPAGVYTAPNVLGGPYPVSATAGAVTGRAAVTLVHGGAALRVVSWKGNYVASTTGFGRASATATGVDLDGDGDRDDASRRIPFDLAAALSPSAGYSGTSARFYGGAEIARFNTTSAPSFSNHLIVNQGSSATNAEDGFGWRHRPSSGGAAHGAIVWLQPDFLAGGAAARLAFTGTSRLALSPGDSGSNTTLRWQNLTGRWLAREGTQWYVSQVTIDPAASDPAVLTFGPGGTASWAPVSFDRSLAIDVSALMFTTRALRDLTGLGFHVANPALGLDQEFWFVVDDFHADVALAPVGYAAWQEEHFPGQIDPEVVGPHASADGDPIPNLIEYATGLDPLESDHDALVPELVGARLRLVFLRAQADLTYVVEGSFDGTAWTAVATNPGAVGQVVVVDDTVDVPATGARMLRLRVE